MEERLEFPDTGTGILSFHGRLHHGLGELTPGRAVSLLSPTRLALGFAILL